ncbi:hypothetical protein CD158_08535, partial [Staphylococcus auricularis]
TIYYNIIHNNKIILHKYFERQMKKIKKLLINKKLKIKLCYILILIIMNFVWKKEYLFISIIRTKIKIWRYAHEKTEETFR